MSFFLQIDFFSTKTSFSIKTGKMSFLTKTKKPKFSAKIAQLSFFVNTNFHAKMSLPDKSSFSAKTINQFFSARTVVLINL